jgi:hypothetical protein
MRARDRAAAALVVVALTASAFFFWLGIPATVLFGLSKATESSTEHFVLGLITVPIAMTAFVPVLFWLNGLYLRVTGEDQAEDPGRSRQRRRPRGPLEYLLLSSLLVTIVVVLVWFFLFAENPPRQVI